MHEPSKSQVDISTCELMEGHIRQNDEGIGRGYDRPCGQDLWPWAMVDVPGSPKLSRLFSLLDLNASNIENIVNPVSKMEPLSLYKTSRGIDEDTKDGVTLSALHEATYTDRQAYLGHPSPSSSGQHLAKSQLPSFNAPYFQVNNSDVFFPTGTWVSPSPWNEIYPFPMPSKPKGRLVNFATASEVSMSSLKSRADRLQAYIATLANLFPPSHPMILKSMEDLARSLSEMGDYSESSAWWKRIVASRESSQGAESLDCLNAMYELIRSLLEQGDGVLDEIATLERRLENLIKPNLPWEHPVATGFLVYKARYFSRKEDFIECERLYRQILQIRLTQLGPRDTETIETMSTLSLTISKRLRRGPHSRYIGDVSHTEEARSSEHLMGAAVQLFAKSGEPYTTAQGQLMGIRHMALLAELGYLEKAVNVAQTGAERFKDILGERHPTTIEYLEYMGHLYEQQGRFDQSINTFRKVLSLQKIDEYKAGHIDRYEGLGKALRGAKQHQEALIYLSKTFRAWQSMFGALNFRTKSACRNLGDSYTHSQQYNEALQLYHRYIDDIRTAADGEHPLISEVNGWVSEVEGLFML